MSSSCYGPLPLVSPQKVDQMVERHCRIIEFNSHNNPLTGEGGLGVLKNPWIFQNRCKDSSLVPDADDDGPRKKLKRAAAEQHVCVTCGRTDSPEWRKGPHGPKTLCNACGLRWAKKARRNVEGEGEGDGAQNKNNGSTLVF